jgi:hypothetical protein
LTALVVPSATIAFVQWCKSVPEIVTALGGPYVSSSLPVNGMRFPWAEVKRITGIPQLPEIPMDHSRIQVNVWGGRKSNGLPDWDACDEPARVILAEVREFRSYGADDWVIKQMAPFEGMQQLEDPETKDARFWFDILCVVRSANG